MSEPRVLGDEIAQVEGPELVQSIVLALRTARYYGADHPAAQQPLDRLRACLSRLEEAAAAEVVLHVVGYAVFLNGALLQLRGPQVVVSGVLRELLGRVDAGGLRFRGTPTIEALRSFLDLFWRAEVTPGTPLAEGGGIVVERRRYQRAIETEVADQGQTSVVAYAQLLAETQQVYERPAEALDPRRLRRSLTELVDSLQSDPDRVVGLLSLRTTRGEPFAHPVNTSVLSLRLGHAVGLGPGPLADVGMVSLLHDFPDAAACDADTSALRRARMTSSLRVSYPTRRLATVVTYEREMPVESRQAAGFYAGARTPHPTSRIAAITDAFEAHTSGTRERRALSPDVALKTMLGEMGRRFDPTLLKLFINVLGLFPCGTPVRLTDGRTAVVVKSPAGAPVARPRVHVLSGKGEGTVLDLGLAEHAGLAIAHAVDPEELSINVTHLFTI